MARARWLWRFTVDVIDQYREDRVGDLAASITFWTLLSIPAAALALISALGSLGRVVGAEVKDDLQKNIVDYILRTFADSQPLLDAVNDLFDANQSRVLTITTAFAIFTLSRGFAGIIRGLDEVYTVVERRSWWHVRLVAVGLGLGTIAVVAGSATVIALLPGRIGSGATVLLVPISLAVLTLWATMLFHFGPHHHTPWRFDLPGAFVTAIGWALATQLFTVYVRISDDGNQVQSTIGALLLGITLLYVLSLVMLVGAEVNDVITRRAGVAQIPPNFRQRVDAARDSIDSARNLALEFRERFEEDGSDDDELSDPVVSTNEKGSNE